MDNPRQRLAKLLQPFARGTDIPPRESLETEAAELLACAEELLAAGSLDGHDRDPWCEYLAVTRHPDFLTALPDAAARNRWAETTFVICENIVYTLGDLFERRCQDQPDHVLFQELTEPGSGSWNYAQVRNLVRAIAAVFLKEGPPPRLEAGGSRQDDGPRVALYCQNSLRSACCDLACLTNDIFISPLNTHFGVDNLLWIFNRLRITVAVCDHPDRLETLLVVRAKAEQPFIIYTLYPNPREGGTGYPSAG